MTALEQTTEQQLTPELLDLMEHEKQIEQGFTIVGGALAAIRDDRKYLAAGFADFDTYLRERWDMSRSYASRQINAAEIVAELLPMGNTNQDAVLPRAERQARPLARLDTPEERREAWVDAVEAAGGQPKASEVEQAVAARLEPQPDPDDDIVEAEIVDETPAPEKPESPKQRIGHPASFSQDILDVVALHVSFEDVVLDPFAGVGGVHQLRERVPGINTLGIELEQEWADEHPNTSCADARDLDDLYPTETFDAIVTSPAYGNRMADTYDPDDDRHRATYTRGLGRTLSDGSAAAMQWGEEYRRFHAHVWALCVSRLKPGGRFILNIKDHVRGDQIQHVAAWHVDYLSRELGLHLTAHHMVPTRGLPSGENHTTRVPCEEVYVLRRPIDEPEPLELAEAVEVSEDGEIDFASDTEPQVPDGETASIPARPWSTYDIVHVDRLVRTIAQMDSVEKLHDAFDYEQATKDRDEVCAAISSRIDQLQS